MAVQPFPGSRSAAASLTNASVPLGAAGQVSLRRALAQIWFVVEGWFERSRQRRELGRMSDHLLRDMGITRTDALNEAGKPFWRP